MHLHELAFRSKRPSERRTRAARGARDPSAPARGFRLFSSSDQLNFAILEKSRDYLRVLLHCTCRLLRTWLNLGLARAGKVSQVFPARCAHSLNINRYRGIVTSIAALALILKIEVHWLLNWGIDHTVRTTGQRRAWMTASPWRRKTRRKRPASGMMSECRKRPGCGSPADGI